MKYISIPYRVLGWLHLVPTGQQAALAPKYGRATGLLALFGYLFPCWRGKDIQGRSPGAPPELRIPTTHGLCPAQPEELARRLLDALPVEGSVFHDNLYSEDIVSKCGPSCILTMVYFANLLQTLHIRITLMKCCK